jgi:Domain of unknown function (DUF1707)
VTAGEQPGYAGYALCWWEALVAAGAGRQMPAGAAGHGHLRASDADREQVIDTLKDAFVEGRLTKDELGARAAQALASRTYAELTAITADIPVGLPGWLIEARPSARPVRTPARKPVTRKAIAWATCMIVLAPTVGAAFLTFYGGFIVLFLLALAGLVATTAP